MANTKRPKCVAIVGSSSCHLGVLASQSEQLAREGKGSGPACLSSLLAFDCSQPCPFSDVSSLMKSLG